MQDTINNIYLILAIGLGIPAFFCYLISKFAKFIHKKLR